METIVGDLRRRIRGLRIREVRVDDERILRGTRARCLARRIEGRGILDVERCGKAVLIVLGPSGILMAHLGMTGRILCGRKAPEATKLVLRLSNGMGLFYNDPRRFGRWEILEDPSDSVYLRTLGPDPLAEGFSRGRLQEILRGSRVAVKPLLMDARRISGIGNIYASEILFAARLFPRRPAGGISDEETSRLHRAMRRVLREAVALRGTTVRDYRDGTGAAGGFQRRLRVYGREGRPCRRCRSPIVRILQHGRSTFFCPRCQPASSETAHEGSSS